MATGSTSATKDYYILDGLGSIVGVTDSTGSLAHTYAYDPYGNSTGGTGSLNQPWQYASGYLDGAGATSGLYKFGARYYDPTGTRWTQLDPQEGSLSDPISLNGYLYVNDDPINAVDQAGTFGISTSNEIVTSVGAACTAGLIFGGELTPPTAVALGACAAASAFTVAITQFF
jgi:RHS repeat-associated protein